MPGPGLGVTGQGQARASQRGLRPGSGLKIRPEPGLLVAYFQQLALSLVCKFITMKKDEKGEVKAALSR